MQVESSGRTLVFGASRRCAACERIVNATFAAEADGDISVADEIEPIPQPPPPWQSDGDAPPSWLGVPSGETEPRACAFCGEVPPPRSSFCPRCGRALTAALLPSQGDALSIVFTDIEDSTFLTDRMGDATWEAIIDEHNDIIREEIHIHAGFEVKLTGDGFLIAFADAVQALHCAVQIQHRVTARADERGASWPVHVRVGIHRGDVILRPGGDILGRAVNMASRIMDKGRGGDIVASAAFVDAVEPKITRKFWTDFGDRRLRGLSERVRVYRFEWPAYIHINQDPDETTPELTPAVH